MVIADLIEDEDKEMVLDIWKSMDEEDKGHFINQVALAMSVWGSEKKGKILVIEIIKAMTQNGTSTLADFGLYIPKIIGVDEDEDMNERIKRAALIVEGYRIKHALSSEPHMELV